LSNQQLNLNKLSKQKLLIKFMIIWFILSYIILNLNVSVLAVTQSKEAYSATKIESYPGFKEKIEALKNAHPNWNFTILYTDLDWNEVIRNETTAAHGRSLVPNTKTGEWLCPTCGDVYDTGKWLCASEIAVSYYMDPRNFLNEDSVFMFEDLGFNETNQSIDGVKKIIANATYLDAQVIMDAAKKVGISPYHLASRIVQEQGTGSKASSTGSGTYPGYEGYYNFLNIGATGEGATSVIINEHKKEKKEEWTTPAISIEKGAEFLAKNYIAKGQSTVYLQKFDVDATGSMYVHQYMQNIMAPASESTKVKQTYKELGAFEKDSAFKINFIIPVYKNMPKEVCPEPKSTGTALTSEIVTQDVEITGNGVNVRTEKSGSAEMIVKLNKGDKVLRIEKGIKEIDGTIWDCIVLNDGTKGYISSDYVKEINTITNCNETVELTGNGVYVRNGPGRDKTTTIASLSKGTQVTRIEKGKYKNIDGYDWDRVKLANGKIGYVASTYLKLVETYTGEKIKKENTNIVCEPKVTVEVLKKTYQNATVKNKKGEAVTTGNIGTGYTVTIDGKSHTVVKQGDTNGDGKMTPADSTVVLRAYLNLDKISDAEKVAADTNGDGKMTPADSTVVLRAYLGLEKVKIN